MENIKTIEPSQPLHYTRKGNYCDNLAFGYALSVSPINLINAYSRMITGKGDFEVNITKQRNFKDLNLDTVSSNINRLLFYANESPASACLAMPLRSSLQGLFVQTD